MDLYFEKKLQVWGSVSRGSNLLGKCNSAFEAGCGFLVEKGKFVHALLFNDPTIFVIINE